MTEPSSILLTALNFLYVGVVFVVMISILVAAHELGHYLFARMFNMGVEEFAVGFGKKPLWTYARRSYLLPLKPGEDPGLEVGVQHQTTSSGPALEGGNRAREIELVETPQGRALKETTNFTIRPWPLGGFVRIKGMIPEDDGSEVNVPGGFYSKAPWKRFLVLLAGPAFSVIAGILILIPLYSIHGIERFSNAPVVPEVAPGTPASVAGIKKGDRVLSVDGRPINTFYEYLSLVRFSGDKTLNIEVEREGLKKTLTARPKWNEEDTPILDKNLEPTGEFARQSVLGISFPPTEVVKLSPQAATASAIAAPGLALKGIVNIIMKPKNFKKTVGGPMTMVAATNHAMKFGVETVLRLAAMLSISVGIFNLLPIFPLDGGQMALSIAEMLRGGKRLSMQVQNAFGTVGFGLVMLLFISVMFVDFNRFFGKEANEKPKPPVEGKAK
jgi:regulator of sigma E protease